MRDDHGWVDAGWSEARLASQSWPWWRCAITGLSALALALSAYLGWHHLAGGFLIGCGGGSPCDEVLRSRWSTIAGVLPVSGVAAGAYLAVLIASFYIGPSTEAPVQWLAWRAMLILVGAAAGSAVWFTIVQKWIMGAFCLYCMATHLTGVLLAVLVIGRARRLDGAGLNKPGFLRENARPALVGLTLAGALAGSQVAFTPKPLAQGGESQHALPAIDPHAVPMIGAPDALTSSSCSSTTSALIATTAFHAE